MGGVMEAVGGENLTEGEEGGECFVFEDDVVAAEGPAVVVGLEVVGKREDAPY